MHSWVQFSSALLIMIVDLIWRRYLEFIPGSLLFSLFCDVHKRHFLLFYLYNGLIKLWLQLSDTSWLLKTAIISKYHIVVLSLENINLQVEAISGKTRAVREFTLPGFAYLPLVGSYLISVPLPFDSWLYNHNFFVNTHPCFSIFGEVMEHISFRAVYTLIGSEGFPGHRQYSLHALPDLFLGRARYFTF